MLQQCWRYSRKAASIDELFLQAVKDEAVRLDDSRNQRIKRLEEQWSQVGVFFEDQQHPEVISKACR